jgi:signal transduction histidine kinase
MEKDLAENEKKNTLYTLDSLTLSQRRKGQYDSTIFYANKELKLAKTRNNTKYIKQSYIWLESAYSKSEKYDSAIFSANKLYELSELTKDTLNMAEALYQRGQSYVEIDSFKLAYKDYINSKKLYLDKGDTIEAAKKLLDIATLEKKQGNFGLSQESCIEGLKYVENTSNIRIIAKLYFTIAVAAKEQGDLVVAEKRINQALSLAKDSKSINEIRKKNIISFYNTQANILKEKGNYEEAIKIYKNILSDSITRSSDAKTTRINSNLAHTLYLKDGFNQQSDSLLKKSLAYYKLEEDDSGLISTNMKLAEMYSQSNKQKAIEYLNEVINQARKLKNKKSLYEAYQQLIRLNNKIENIDRYLALEKKVGKEKDSIESRLVNAKFDIGKSENKRIIAENKANRYEIKEARRTKQLLGLLLVLVILLVLTFFIYQRIQRRHKIEKVKTVHVTEARISSKVHDELANDLYELMTQLETANPEKETVLDKLDTIYNQARDISKQIQTVETDHRFPEELNNLFRSYQSDEVNVLLKRYDTDIWKGISSHIKVTVYRVLQEFLTNMKKHSNAALVVVSIEKQNKQLFIQYIDNGKGFTAKTSKNGLLNAENRIRAIKGKLTFDTELDKGCKFSINVPV